MNSKVNIEVFKPTDWQRFETISLEALKIMYNNPNFTKHGRPGQKQDGVDIYLQESGEVIAAQCKLTFKTINEKIILEEIEKAKKFKPSISVLYICTTSPKDTILQEVIRCISLERGLQCYILFWDDIIQHIRAKKEIFDMLFRENIYADEKEVRDIETLKILFSNVDLCSIQKTIEEQLPEYIDFDFITYFELFAKCWCSCVISFNDLKLRGAVDGFYHSWNKVILETQDYFHTINGGVTYGLNRNYDIFSHAYYEKIKNNIDMLRKNMNDALKEMVAYINNRYPCINLYELSQVAKENMKSSN